MIGTTAAILGATGLGSSLLGGIFGNKAAKSAAQRQADAAKLAGDQLQQVIKDQNPLIQDAEQHGSELVRSEAGTQSGLVTDAANKANELLNPYTKSGSTAADVLNRGIADGGEFNRAPTLADLQIDPGYQFRLDQGNLALERSQAARGASLGGGAIKEALAYNSGQASQEYQNAFNRFQTSTQNRFSNVFNVSEQGRGAATTQGNNTTEAAQVGANLNTNAAQIAAANEADSAARRTNNTIQGQVQAGEYATQGANAQAAGQVAGTNALWGGITGGINSAAQTLLLNKLLKNPSLNYLQPSAATVH